MIKKRQIFVLLTMVLAFTVMAGIFTGPAAAKSPKVIKWKLVEFYTTMEFPTKAWREQFISEIKEATGGRLQITQLVMGEHPYSMFDALKAAREMAPEIMEMPYSASSGEDRRLAVFDLPMLFPSDVSVFYEMRDRFSESFFNPTMAKFGYQPFIRFTWPPQRIGGTDFFVSDWDSLKGKRVRVWNPQLGALIKLMGGIPVTISWGEIATSLQTGLIEGVITNSGSMYLAKFFANLKCLTTMEIQYGAHDYVINQKALAALPDDVRNALLKWAAKKEPLIRKEICRFYEERTERAIPEFGITIKAPDPTFREEVRAKCWEAIWKPYIEAAGGLKGPTGKTFNALAKSLIEAGYTVPGYTPY